MSRRNAILMFCAAISVPGILAITGVVASNELSTSGKLWVSAVILLIAGVVQSVLASVIGTSSVYTMRDQINEKDRTISRMEQQLQTREREVDILRMEKAASTRGLAAALDDK